MDRDFKLFCESLIKRKITVTTAESCTGGLIAARLVDYPGISEVFHEGYVTYSNEAKIRRLSVDPSLIDTYGVVSAEVASAMAEGAAGLSGSDLAISSTGIAGPGGGDDEHPVGLVYIGAWYKGVVKSRRFIFSGDRSSVRAQAVDEAIRLASELTAAGEIL